MNDTNGKILSLGKNEVTIRVRGEETGGAYTVLDMVVGPGPVGVTPPAHRHAFAETFYVLEGVLGGQIEGEPFEAPVGTAVDVAGGLAHAWWNAGSAPVRTLVICTPGGFERYFEELAAAVAELPPGPPDVAKVRSIIARLWPEYGIEPVVEPIS